MNTEKWVRFESLLMLIANMFILLVLLAAFCFCGCCFLSIASLSVFFSNWFEAIKCAVLRQAVIGILQPKSEPCNEAKSGDHPNQQTLVAIEDGRLEDREI